MLTLEGRHHRLPCFLLCQNQWISRRSKRKTEPINKQIDDIYWHQKAHHYKNFMFAPILINRCLLLTTVYRSLRSWFFYRPHRLAFCFLRVAACQGNEGNENLKRNILMEFLTFVCSLELLFGNSSCLSTWTRLKIHLGSDSSISSNSSTLNKIRWKSSRKITQQFVVVC